MLQYLTMIKAVIFDMDGVLIDSEPLWWQAEIEVLTKVGVPLTEKMCRQTIGLRIEKAVAYWYKKYPWGSTPSKRNIERDIHKKVKELFEKRVKLMPGIIDLVDFFKNKDLKLALASSSDMELINIIVDKLKLRKYFSVIHSAEFEKHAKPHPDVYLTTAKELGVRPEECLVFEDSPVGVEAAKRARMKCIAIPVKALRNDPKIQKADMTISSFAQIRKEMWRKLAADLTSVPLDLTK